MSRIEVRAQILSCTSCDLSERCKAPVPFDGPTPAVLAVVGEAPGKLEDDAGQPCVSPSGELLKESLAATGIDPDLVVYLNAVSCFPTDADGKGRAPNSDEIQACADNLRAQMDVSGANFFLLTGEVPLRALRPGLKIGKARGVPFLLDATRTDMGDRIALPTYHPSYILRSGGRGGKPHGLMLEDMKYLQRLMEVDPANIISLFPETCIECGDWSERFDDDGIGWCGAHWKGNSA